MLKKSSVAHLGIWLQAAGFVGSFSIFILSLPGVGRGIWPQSELAVAGLHFFAALCAAGLFIVFCKYKKTGRSTLLHPLVLIPFFLGLLSLFLMPSQALPVRHFLGAPQSGEGVVWWFDWAILTASALFLWRVRLWRMILTATAFLSFAMTAGLTLAHMHFDYPTTPYFFPDFLAFNLVSLAPLATGLLKTKKAFVWYGLSFLFAVTLYLTQNQVAIAFGLVGVPFFILLELLFRKNERLKTRLSYLTVALLPFVALASIFTLIHMMGSGGFYEFSKLEYFRNIISRGYMIEIGLHPLADSPLSILTGTGWGSFTEHVVDHLPTKWFDFTQEGSKQWEGVSWDQFHTHDIFVDTLFSIGIVGLILLYVYFLAIPFYTKPAQKRIAPVFSAFLVSVASFWFLFPVNVPFITLAVGAMGKQTSRISLRPALFKKALWVLPVIIALQMSAVLIHWHTISKTSGYDARALSVSEAEENCPLEYGDAGAGGLHLARVLVAHTRMLLYQAGEEGEESREDLEKRLRKVNHLFCQAQVYIDNNPASNRLLVARLLTQGEILLGIDWLEKDTQQLYLKDWRRNLTEWLAKIPQRSDQAVPFILWHLIHGQEKEVSEIATLIYSTNNQDPVGLWFTGLELTLSPATAAEGLTRMRKALKKGIERYVPIEEGVKEQLLAAGR